MNILKCKRSELAGVSERDGWLDVFHQCGLAPRADGEDRDHYQKFKYACGRNFDRVMSKVKEIRKEVEEIMMPSDFYDEFMRKVEAINRKHCLLDEKGEPDLTVNENGTGTYKFTDERRALRDAELEALKAQPTFAAAIEDQNEKRKAAAAFMEEPCEVELYTVPWSWLPERAGSAYLARLSVMCTDVPPEIAEDVAKVLAGNR